MSKYLSRMKETVVMPLAVSSVIVPVVRLLAVKPITAAPVNTPVLVTVKAVAVVEEDVMSPKATTDEPPIVVVDGSVTVAPSPTDTSRLVRIPAPYFTTGT